MFCSLNLFFFRRLHQLEEEVKRVKNNDSLSSEEKELIIAEKHNAIMKPVGLIPCLCTWSNFEIRCDVTYERMDISGEEP